jgi:peptide methionine sulfoxide reductase msrA/msrB
MQHLLIYFFLVSMLYACAEENTSNLTPEEERVIVHKGTEMPFTGKYYNHWETGDYHCRRCDAPLYKSDTKFDAGCGWPSFDDEIPGAVKRAPDADGRRTEILCAKCGAHLAHVFLGEGSTPIKTLHCVKSISLTFKPEVNERSDMKTEKAVFAGGCFWGVEFLFQDQPGVIATRVGYTGGRTEQPTYEQVCGGDTGHVEALEVTFDPSATTYEALARRFFEIHDPTQVNRQGPDRGEQYRSAVFYLDDKQRDTALKLIEELKAKGYAVATTVEKAAAFWPAEDYHQRYYTKKNGRPIATPTRSGSSCTAGGLGCIVFGESV